MPMLRKSFRIEKEIWDALVAEKQCPSRLIRLFILAGIHQMKIPHYDEILLLTKLEEQARKVGVNTNQAVRGKRLSVFIRRSYPSIGDARTHSFENVERTGAAET